MPSSLARLSNRLAAGLRQLHCLLFECSCGNFLDLCHAKSFPDFARVYLSFADSPKSGEAHIGPHIREIESVWMQFIPMTTVVFDISATMTADGNRYPWTGKGLRLSFAKVQQAVMGRVQPALDRQPKLDINGNPMPESKRLPKICPQPHIPLRQVIEKEASAWGKHPDALGKPGRAPSQIVLLFSVIVYFVAMCFSQIKRRICENKVNGVGRKGGK
jgi:hypothetical protein